MGCVYTYKKTEGREQNEKVKVLGSVLDLAREYYKDGKELKNTKVFSSNDIVNSISEIINKEIINNKESIIASDKKGISDIISEYNPDLMQYLGLSQDRLQPEYKEDQRILHYILESFPVNFKDRYATLQGLKTAIRDNEPLNQLYDEKFKEISEILEAEELTKELSISINKALGYMLKGEDIESVIDTIIKTHEELLNNPQEWKSKLLTIFSRIRSEINTALDDGAIFTGLNIDTIDESSAVKMKGNLDILIIDKFGTPHLYMFKLSKNGYDDWDTVKKNTTDWQMAFFRGLLGQRIDVRNATLNIIPISFGKVENAMIDGKPTKKLSASNLKYDSQVALLTYPQKGLRTAESGSEGKLTRVVNTLLKQKTVIPFDDSKERKFLSKLENLLGANYEIKTSNSEYNVDRIVENAKEKGNYDLFNSFSDNLSEELVEKMRPLGFYLNSSNIFKYDWPNGISSIEKEAKFREAVTIYSEFCKAHRNNNLVTLKNSIQSAIKSGASSISWNNQSVETKLNNTLKHYLLGNYTLINNIPELDRLGFILLQNNNTNRYSIISVSSYTNLASFSNGFNYGDVEYMKAYLFFNEFSKELNLNYNKIEGIEVFNIQQGTNYFRSDKYEFEKFSNLMKRKNVSLNLNVKNLQEDSETIMSIIRNVVRNNPAMKNYSAESSIELLANAYETPNVEKLKEIQEEMRKSKEFSYLTERSKIGQLSYNDEKEYLYALVSTLVILKSELTPFGDYIGMKDYAISFSDFASIFRPLFTDVENEYDENGKKIQGIIGSLQTITPDKVPSVDLKQINNILNGANSFIRQNFYKESAKISSLTRDYFKKIHYTPTEQNWLGNYRGKYDNMWVKESGKISNIWSVKNPYRYDENNALSDEEREHLKKMLFEIKKYELGLENEKVDITSLETLKNSKGGLAILNAIENGNYFKMALVRNQQMTRYGSIWKNGYSALVDKAQNVKNEFDDIFTDKELEADERVKEIKSNLGYYEMYDLYGRQTDSFKKEMIDKNGADYYEISLDIIAHRVAFNKIRQNHMNKILPIVNSYMWWIKLKGGSANEDVTKILEYISHRIDLAAYDSSLVDPEFEDITKAASAAKRITTIGMLAFRPVLLFKELIIGMYKGVTIAATKIYGGSQFSLASYTKAVKMMITIDKQASTQWNLLDGINNYYGFANRDANSLAAKLQTNRRGILMGLSPWMYSCNTIPDYYNRLSLFLSKMIEEGSIDAHTMEDGFLIYNARKDKRFSRYLAERESHKDKFGNYIPATNDEEYNKQRRMYLLVMSELNEERQRFGLESFSENGDKLIDHAYSEKERLGFKSFTDTVYGYYDKDSQPEWHNKWYGIVFLQFLQFWPGKMSLWTGKGISAEASTMGEHVQKIKKDENGKAILDENGKEILIWRKENIDEDGKITFEETEENTGDPLLEWTGTPQEGLMQSILKTIRYALTGDMGKFKSDKLLQRRFMYGIADGMLMMLIFGIVAAIIKGWIDENGTDGLDGQTISFFNQVNNRVLSEANVFNNTFGALSTTPAFYSYGTKILGDLDDVVVGNKTIGDFSKNIKALEILRLNTDEE